ncbi:MAG TPA: phospholipase D-like domain-containing protein [Mesorhizobium sp.]|nr:phospholipase D-like domain-containing protein [Mesorhizobium sp.]
MTDAKGRAPVLEVGRTCWRKARSGRFALIVDAADYFKHLKDAMTRARHQILLIGWDFDPRIRLSPENSDGEWPNRLGDFINALVERRPELNIHVLKWDLGVIYTMGRGSTPLFVLDWLTDERIHLRLDGVHPPGACHHHKIAVIDDAVAFCGGIDITVGRWDTPEHLDRDERRDSPWGFSQPPWHDATAAVDRDGARVIGELARKRWKIAEGEDLPTPPDPEHDVWPEGLEPSLHDVEVGIARTRPEHGGYEEEREIEALYLAAIASAERSIYIESQYFASHRVAEVIERRLGEPDGPEIVIVNPLSTDGWLEETVMGAARAVLFGRCRKADRFGRFRMYHPVASGGTPIYVHAKVMVVDDRLLKVGSSNLNNRSMGLDTECDITVEADRPDVSEGICAARRRLLAEHLGVEPADVARAEEESGGSLIAVIEGLRKPEGRTLVPLEPAPVTESERLMVDERLLDPERPRSVKTQVAKLARAGRAVFGGSAGRKTFSRAR